VVVAAVFVKFADLLGMIDGLRLMFGLFGDQGQWLMGTMWVSFAVLIWLGYAFWFGIVLPGSIDRFFTSRKLHVKRRKEMLESLKEFEQLSGKK